jgi:hypothetical protein
MQRLALGGAVFLALLVAAVAAAEAPKSSPPLDAKALDKLLYDSLREVHDRGADLYNSGEHLGCYRMFQGALRTARGVLAHRPASQKLIDDGLAAAEKQPAISQRAFQLHELVEKVRADLRPEGVKPDAKKGEPDAKKGEPPLAEPAKDKQKMPEGPKLEPTPKEPRELAPEPKKQPPLLREEPEKKDGKKELGGKDDSPFGRAKSEPPKLASGVGGRVLFEGKPLGGVDVTFVSRGEREPRVFQAACAADGTYAIPEVKPGHYTVLLTSGQEKPVKGLPERYALTNTSPLVVEVKPGGEMLDFLLQ